MVVEFSHCGWEKKWDGKKNNHVTYLEMFIDLVLHLKPKGKKQTTFLCSYLLVLTFSVSFEN